MSKQPLRYCVISAIFTGILLCSCRDPFRTYEDEIGQVADPLALQTIEALRLDDHAVNEVENDGRVAREPRPDPFANLEQKPVNIEQCRAWMLEHNLKLQVALIDPEISVTIQSEEEAQFEAVFTAAARGSDADPSQSEVFPDQFVRPFDFNPAVEIPLRTGGRVRISLPIARDQSFGGLVDDRYSTDLEFSFRHPLLRGAGRRTNTHGIRIAALDSQISQARTKLEVIRQLANVDRAYWLLHESKRILEIRQEQFENARTQLNMVDERFKAKLGPEIEVIRAEAGLSRRLETIIVAELVVRDRQRLLKQIMNLPGLDVDSDVMLELSSRPTPVRYELDAQRLLDASLDQRMELLELELQLAQDLSTIDLTRNQKLPLFTLDYRYRVDGQAGSFGRSLDSLANAEGHGWQVGLTVEVPLGNEAAQSRAHRAILIRLQRLATRSLREQVIKQEVLSALDNLRATWQRILASRQNRLLEMRNYEAEQGQYQLGRRNSTEVLDAEDRLANAKISEIEAIVDYQVAQIDLAFATGTLLGASQVSW